MKMFSKVIVLAASALMAIAAQAGGNVAVADVGKQVPVVYSEKTSVTQVLVGDGKQTYLMVSAEDVADTVMVTQEMANNAVPFNVVTDTLPKIVSLGQLPNAEETEGTNTPFLSTGRMEPVSVAKSVVTTVYFAYDGSYYKYDMVGEVPQSVTLTQDVLNRATKV